jgi:hypothetical protein
MLSAQDQGKVKQCTVFGLYRVYALDALHLISLTTFQAPCLLHAKYHLLFQ